MPVEELSRQHLVAEYRELPRVYALSKAAQARGENPPRLGSYRLGAGHVRFFYDRLSFVAMRHQQLVGEMKRRGYSANYLPPESLADHDPEWCLSWEPDQQAIELNRQRIKERS